MKPSAEQFTAAVLEMADLIPWFPQAEKTQTRIGEAMCEFVYSEEGLYWLTTQAIRQVKDWRKFGGIPGLRDLYRGYLRELDAEENDAKIALWRAEQKLLTSGSQRQQVVAIREPRMVLRSKIWPAELNPDPDYKALEEPDPDHPGQWRLKQTGPIRTPEEFARGIQELEAKLEELQKRG